MDASISIIIVTWQSRPTLEKNIARLVDLCAQSHIRLTIVDNDSNDQIEEFIQLRIPQARLIENPSNLGFSRACNIGAAAAESEFLLFLNPDAAIGVQELQTLLDALQSDPQAAIAGPLLLNARGRFYPSAHRDPNALNYWITHSLLAPIYRWLRSLLPVPRHKRETQWLMGACLLARRESFEQVGSFPEDYFLYSEDAELCWRLRQRNWKVLFVPQVVCFHDHAQSSQQNLLSTRVALFQSLMTYGKRCRTNDWLRAMRRSILWDMRMRNMLIAIGRLANPSYDRDGIRRESIRQIIQHWNAL